MTAEEQLKYPIGKFQKPLSYTETDILTWIDEIKTLPGKLRQAVMPLSEELLDTPYRPGGWTLRQVVHHIPDSHLNSLTRFKLAMTEDNPTIKPYEEDRWALLADYRLPVESSLKMLEAIHIHLVALFESFTEDDWSRTFYHPANDATSTLKRNLALYAWHGNHHLAHITETMKRF